MFESLSERLGGVFDRLTKQGALSEADVVTALREVRTALLEADVSLPVARDFIKRVTQKAPGSAVTNSNTSDGYQSLNHSCKFFDVFDSIINKENLSVALNLIRNRIPDQFFIKTNHIGFDWITVRRRCCNY